MAHSIGRHRLALPYFTFPVSMKGGKSRRPVAPAGAHEAW
jgi:hypothetical protein